MVDSDIKPSMAFLYGEIVKAKEQIKLVFPNNEQPANLVVYNNIIEIIDNKMKDRLDSPLHLAAYLLNPYYSYNDDSIFTSEQVMDGFITAVETFYHGDYDKQSKVLNEELHKFKDKHGHFGKPVAKAGCKDFDFSPCMSCFVHCLCSIHQYMSSIYCSCSLLPMQQIGGAVMEHRFQLCKGWR
jgi:hypothetical protein